MTAHSAHPHAVFDRFPPLLHSLAAAYGDEGIQSLAERIADAEAADFHWDSRFAERNLGAYECIDDADDSGELVRIIGYFQSRYYVATCVVDAARRLRSMLTVKRFDTAESAESAFLTGGG